jgi:hypothetical protein
MVAKDLVIGNQEIIPDIGKLLELEPVFEGSLVVSQVQPPARAHPGEAIPGTVSGKVPDAVDDMGALLVRGFVVDGIRGVHMSGGQSNKIPRLLYQFFRKNQGMKTRVRHLPIQFGSGKLRAYRRRIRIFHKPSAIPIPISGKRQQQEVMDKHQCRR